MKGKTYKIDGVWKMEYSELKKVHGHNGTRLTPVSRFIKVDKDSLFFCEEGKEFDFTIKSVYVEPPESIHCNRGSDVEMAFIIFPNTDKPDSLADIIKTKDQADAFMKRLDELGSTWEPLRDDLRMVLELIGSPELDKGPILDRLMSILDEKYYPPVKKRK